LTQDEIEAAIRILERQIAELQSFDAYDRSNYNAVRLRSLSRRLNEIRQSVQLFARVLTLSRRFWTCGRLD
jgi:hypothetical protein